MRYDRKKKLTSKETEFEKQRFSHYATTRSSLLDTRAREAWELSHNDRDGTDSQYTASQIEKLDAIGAPHVSINIMYPILSHIRGLLVADAPMGRVVPSDDLDKTKAAIYERICDAVYRKSQTRMAFTKGVKEMLNVYYSCIVAEPTSFYRPGMFDLTITHASWEDVFPDPDARETGLNMRDSEAIYIARLIPERKCKNIYGFVPDRNMMGNLLMTEVFNRPEEQDNQRVCVRDIYEKVFGIYTVVQGYNRETRQSTIIKKVLSEQEFNKYNSQEETNPFSVKKYREGVFVRRRLLVGDEISIFDELLPLTDYPIAFLTADDYSNPFGKSPAEYLREPQKAINKFWQLVYLNAMLSSNTRFMGPAGSFVDKDAWQQYGAAAGHTYEYNADPSLPDGGKPSIIAPLPLNSAFFQMGEQLKAYAEYATSTFPVAMGDPTNAPNTAGATQGLQTAGTTRVREMKSRIATAFAMGVWMPVMQYINQYARRDQIIRYLDDNNEWQRVNLNEILDDESIPEFDMQIGIKTALPTDRERLLQLMQTAISQTADPQAQRVIFEEALKLQDYPVMDSLFKKLDTVANLTQQLQQAGEQIKQLTSQVNTLSNQVMQGQKQIEMTKFAADLSDMKSQAQAQQQVAQAQAAAQPDQVPQLQEM